MAGCIETTEALKLQRMVFRITKGNALIYISEIDESLTKDDKQLLDPKSVSLFV